MKVIVGIGNPGKRYEKTRHNVGFRVLDRMAERLKARFSEKKVWAAQAVEWEDRAWLVKPDTFVNCSGEAVASFFGKDNLLRDLLVVCDDANLDFGKLRLREKGSPGGHHGLESIQKALGTGDFARLRIGIRSAKMPKDLAPFVLERFDREEIDPLEALLDRAATLCEVWVCEGFESAQRRLSQLQTKQ